MPMRGGAELCWCGMNEPTPLPLALLANRVFKACEADFFDALSAAGHQDLRMRHTALFEALDPSGTRASVLAERLGMTQQAMGQLLEDMETAGYVSRVPDPKDRRARLVTLTDQGQAAVTICYDVLRTLEAGYADLLGGAKEFATLKQGLAQLMDALSARGRLGTSDGGGPA